MNKYTLAIVTAIILAAVLFGWWYNTRRLRQDMDNLREAHKLEMEFGELNKEYDQLSMQFEGNMFKIGNDSLFSLLTTEQAKVQQLMEELRTVKATNSKRINELKNELETLRKIMRGYVVQIDSLNTANERLTREKNQAERRYQTVSSEKEKIEKELEKQTERVTLASRLDATNITIIATNERGKTVKRIKQMTQFVVTFRIARNITAPTGEKTIYVRIKKPDDDILVKNRSNIFPFEGREINYSMKRIIEYDGEEQSVTMYWDIEEYLSPGTYRADIFADGNLIGQQPFELSDK
ncbi:MAG: hypothetical protein LBH04_10700 [Tannerellaceae bacterium]|jgi:hypothetical protein|nr:hypothetical protein [Tannerellaceae bacterium]